MTDDQRVYRHQRRSYCDDRLRDTDAMLSTAADQVVDADQSAVRSVISSWSAAVTARVPGGNYYTEFVKQTPPDTRYPDACLRQIPV